MIKKILGFGIFLFSLISFSSAGKVQEISLNQLPSIYDSNYDLGFLKGGSVLTTFLGQSKSIIAFDSDSFFWWSSNGQPYYYNDSSVQGFFGEYWACDELTGSDSVPTNCSSSPITGDYKSIFSSFFNNVKLGDYVYYDFENNWYSQGSTSWAGANRIWICWSSSTIHRSLCFRRQYYNCSRCDSTQKQDYGSLVNSQNLSNLSFGAISNSWIGYAPGQKGYVGGGNIDGSSSIGENVSLTGNFMYNTCTNGYIINKLKNLWGDSLDYVCYAGTYDTGLIDNNFEGVNYIYDYGLNYRDLFKLTDGGMSWRNWFSTYENDMLKWKSGIYSVNPFLSQPVALYSYFENLYNNGYLQIPDNYEGGPYTWLNFCNLYLYSDFNEEYKGTYFKPFCNDLTYNDGGGSYNTGEIGNIDDGEVLPPGYDPGDSSVSSSGAIVSVDWSGTLSGETNKNFDGKTFINDFYQKLQSKFQNPINNLLGIVPGYILVFMFALILFRFLSH